jgi:hypothetical protein
VILALLGVLLIIIRKGPNLEKSIIKSHPEGVLLHTSRGPSINQNLLKINFHVILTRFHNDLLQKTLINLNENSRIIYKCFRKFLKITIIFA